MRNLKGSNQWRTKYRYRFWKSVLAIVAFLAIIAFLGAFYESKIDPTKGFISPVPANYNPHSPQIFKYQRSEKEEILSYIIKVWGKWSDKVIVLVSMCENRSFNPYAVHQNDNGTKDWSILQVNDVHAKRYGDSFKTDWKSNVLVAYDIFKRSGNKFAAWSCNYVL